MNDDLTKRTEECMAYVSVLLLRRLYPRTQYWIYVNPENQPTITVSVEHVRYKRVSSQAIFVHELVMCRGDHTDYVERWLEPLIHKALNE